MRFLPPLSSLAPSLSLSLSLRGQAENPSVPVSLAVHYTNTSKFPRAPRDSHCFFFFLFIYFTPPARARGDKRARKIKRCKSCSLHECSVCMQAYIYERCARCNSPECVLRARGCWLLRWAHTHELHTRGENNTQRHVHPEPRTARVYIYLICTRLDWCRVGGGW